MHKRALFLIFLSLSSISLHAQLFGPSMDTTRTWRFKFDIDMGAVLPYFTERDAYQGESLLGSEWTWRQFDSTLTNLTSFNKINLISLSMGLNLYRGLYLGFSYHPLIVRGFSTNPGGGGVYTRERVLVALAGNLSYDWALPFYDRISIQPSISAGNYQSNPYHEGVGSEYFGEAKLGIGYRPLRLHYLRAWVAYGGYSYRESTPSLIFPQTRVVKSDFRYLNVGVGVSFRLPVREEPLPEDDSKKKKKKRKSS
ncbi:MAG: hypothetical protein NWR72_01635 [Bacteroidia bacterium]|nr:hypothetical protein [Bacteroidia bacterium]